MMQSFFNNSDPLDTRINDSDPLKSAENSEVAEEPPQHQEDEDGAKAATAEFFRSISRGEAAQQLAH
jgi:hypothetical protein